MQTTILQVLKADELRRIVRRTATKVCKPRRQTLLLLQKRGLRLRSERRRAATELLLLQRRLSSSPPFRSPSDRLRLCHRDTSRPR